MASDGTGLLAWISRASGNRRVVKVPSAPPAGASARRRSSRAPAGRTRSSPRSGRRASASSPSSARAPVRALPHGGPATGARSRTSAPSPPAPTTTSPRSITSGGRATIADVHRQLSEGGDAGPLLVDAWVRPVGATRFRAAQRLEQADGVAAQDPALVPAESRGAVLAWAGGDPGAPPTPDGPSTRVKVSVMGADGRYGPAQPLSAAAQPVKAVAAASNGSTAIVSWVRIDPASDGDGQVMAAAAAGVRRVRRARGGLAERERLRDRAGLHRARPPAARSCCGRRGPAARGRACRSRQIRTFVRFAQRTP